MRCENYLCIYWLDNNCTLDCVTLDVQGRCQELIYVTIEENILKHQREIILER